MRIITRAFLFLLFTISIVTAQEIPEPKKRNSESAPKSDGGSLVGSGAIKSSLSEKKLQLEINKLESELKRPRVEYLLQFGTLSIALSAAAISFWSAWKTQSSHARTLRHQNENQRQERVTGLLKELGSSNNGVRVAAIQALSDYPDTHRFLVNLLKYESDPHIYDAIVVSLQRKPSASLHLLVESMCALKGRLLLLASGLYSLDMPTREIASLLHIESTVLRNWFDSTLGKRAISEHTAQVSYRSVDDNVDSDDDEKPLLIKQWSKLSRSIYNTRGAIEAVVTTACENKQSVNLEGAFLNNIVLDGLDLSKWSFKNCELQGSSFRDSVCKNCDFTGADLLQSSFVGARLQDAIFDNSNCQSVSFKRAALARASFINTDAGKATFIAAKGKGVNFERAHLVGARFEHFIGTGVNFINTNLKGAIFSGATINDSVFENVDISGAIFVGTNARRLQLSDITAAGSRLSHIDLRGSAFNKVRFSSIKEFEGSKFAGSTIQDVNFDQISYDFSQYVKNTHEEPSE